MLIGNAVAQHTLTASQVVAIGARAFSENTSGWYNCVMGADSFVNTGSSAKNVALGAFSGYQVNTNNSCIMGYQAAYGKDARLCDGSGRDRLAGDVQHIVRRERSQHRPIQRIQSDDGDGFHGHREQSGVCGDDSGLGVAR